MSVGVGGIDKHARSGGNIDRGIEKHVRFGGYASHSSAAASASASNSGGIGDQDRSRSGGMGRSKWERFDRLDGTDSSEHTGCEGKGKVKVLVDQF